MPACAKLGVGSPWYVKAIQALGFCRWKQSRFSVALGLFVEMEKLVGECSSLAENIGHTYNSMGNHAKAEEYFEKVLWLIFFSSGKGVGGCGCVAGVSIR